MPMAPPMSPAAAAADPGCPPRGTAMDSHESSGRLPPVADLLVQARKALSHRSPFDADEAGPRVPNLPAGLAAVLSRPLGGRRKHKKSHGETPTKPSGPSAGDPSIWDETEDYFRPVNLVDVDGLAYELALGSAPLDSCFFIPRIGNDVVSGNKDIGAVAASLEASSAPVTENKEEVLVSEVEKTEVEETLLEKTELVGVNPMEVDEVGTSGSDALPQQEGDEDSSSLHWLLGSRERCALTSERPNKKRKLLGEDAGLDRLIVLPCQQNKPAVCDLCCLGDSKINSNSLLCCDSCKAVVHLKCYGMHEVQDGTWLCSWCKHLETAGKLSKKGHDMNLKPCVLCPNEGGALKPIRSDSDRNQSIGALKFAHLFCSLWIPEVYVENMETMALIINTGGQLDARKKLVCNVCKVRHGACLRCSHGTCRTSFHPQCARGSKYQMEIWGKFECENVELRAFCSKHSNFQDMGIPSDFQEISSNITHQSTTPKPISPHEILPDKKILKLRFTRKNSNSMVQDETAISNSDKILKKENNVLLNSLASRVSCDLDDGCEADINMETDTDDYETDNTKLNVDNVAAVLRKLIDRGKVNADDVALEVGISSDSLKAAIVGETTSFSPGLRMKIIKWLQSNAHVTAVQSKGRNNPADTKVPKIIASNSAKDIDSDVHFDDQVNNLEISDGVHVRSLPPRRRTKNNIRVLKDNEAICSTELAIIPEFGSDKKLDEISPFLISEDVKGSADDKIYSLSKEQAPSEKIGKQTIKTTGLSPQLDLPLVEKGNIAKKDVIEIPETQLSKHDSSEQLPSFESGIVQAAAINKQSSMDSIYNHHCSHADNTSNEPHLKIDEPSYPSYVHPFIKEKLVGMTLPVLHNQNIREEITNELDLLDKAKSMRITELSPDDEVEGELVYHQTKLLDKSALIKHIYEDLIFKVVRALPQELDAPRKRKWDLVLVTQFLREIREAKKRGRKERRHKEAQAVLAAAAAVAAASSRNSLLRKDANDEIISTTQETTMKRSNLGRSGQQTPLVPRTKESSRPSVSKVSLDKHAGLFQLPEFSKDNALSCEICMRAETLLNRIFVCSTCKVSVHLDCYRRTKNSIGSWKCELCEAGLLESSIGHVAECTLCGGNSGAFRKSTDEQWVHAFCAEWLLGSKFKRGQEHAVEGMDAISKEKNTCCICHRDYGVCLKCSNGQCQLAFHPYCARGAGFYMNAKSMDGSLQHKAYCAKHSLEQREVDNQQYGAEELKNIKQIRVELEKLRLLCERIIKREKLKRDLILCSHDILASKREYAAYSVLVRSSFPSGISSESATTSINTKSYSGNVQRSDDVTVDSTLSGKRTIRLSLHNKDVDRNSDDNTTSQPLSKRKLADRMSLAGKQLPQRSSSLASRNPRDGEKKAKSRKHIETFQKELVMTSDQASMQNQRLPKGLVYVPIGHLSIDKPLNNENDSPMKKNNENDSHEPQEPGG